MVTESLPPQGGEPEPPSALRATPPNARSARRREKHPGGESSATVLVVEDESAITDALRYAFELEGFAFESASTGRAGLDAARRLHPSVIVLDVMLPGLSGLDVCRQIRSESDVPIIMLTARGAEADKVAGLELGADDYLTKPFSIRELVARVRAQVRRSARSGSLANTSEVLRGGPIELDIDAHEVRLGGAVVDLRPKEFDLLESLMRRPGRLATRETLIEEVWGPDHFGATKTLDVHIKRLRQKLETDSGRPRHILTVRGLGYKFVD